MYTMKEVCDTIGISYETLRFYCNEGLVPNVKRDKNNYREFDERNISWLKSLQCLRKSGMSLKDMKLYMQLCMKGQSTIGERKIMLNKQKHILLQKMEDINECIAFIDHKLEFYAGVENEEIAYTSNLIQIDE